MALTTEPKLQEERRTQVDPASVLTLAQLQFEEAKWVTTEHDEFIKLIQRYRNLYVTALFVAFGWALGQVLGSPPTTLEALRARPDVAAVLSVLPLINVLFALLMLEAHSHAADLARYRFLLGMQLHHNEPPWRWNLWREKQKTSILRQPTMFLNAFSAVLFLLLTVGALWFSYPALGASRWLWMLWGPSLLIFISFLVMIGIVALYWMRGAGVVTRKPQVGERWSNLWLVPNNPISANLTPQERARLWLEWTEKHAVGGPPLSDYAVSRESIYKEREDAQL